MGGQGAMAGTRIKLTTVVEGYLDELCHIRAPGGATSERSHCPPVTDLANAAGATSKTKVFCITELAQQGASLGE